MNISQVNLREAVMANVSDSSLGELRSTIMDAIESREDKTLPGLGVLFEVLWNQADPSKQGEILQLLHQGLGQK
ncbi:small acid-soluble spore protein SspI [Ammoniphilus sp. CFH 90114]|uniref:small acid-soluble spore protein SspI n=1 Tax=Ammoniphilus sp. CFH 90114 TaxID=2493665 RepID=UPI00100EA5C2|nr:small acid-soluble spore protein SspI [Ammoniphilus sp. CFH 90114]RXT04747.1 small acid-soluble spore protein SspI [Ammoniphilus sp. CFH 90114]